MGAGKSVFCASSMKKSITIGEQLGLLPWGSFVLCKSGLAETSFPRIPFLIGLQVNFYHRKYFHEIWKVEVKYQ